MARKLTAKTTTDDAAPAQQASAPKKRGRPPKAASAAPLSNVSGDTIKAAIVEVGAAKTDLESAQGVYRNLLKKWEERGVPSEWVTWGIKQRKREVGDIERDIRWMNRMLAIQEIPVGSQLGLFEDGESIGTKVDKAKAETVTSDDDIAKAKAAGYEAGTKGIGEEANPHPDGSPSALAWAAERRRATVDRAREAFGGGKSAADLAGESVEGMRALRDTEVAGAA